MTTLAIIAVALGALVVFFAGYCYGSYDTLRQVQDDPSYWRGDR